ncbi:MAG: peptidoglycan DD-metalloendopeptidase family protein [Oscillospiraceae bacterium]
MTEVVAPAGAQLLFYPMTECTISAGYKNALYQKDKKYPHYGIDFDDRWGKDFDVLASGAGTVLATEKNSNSIGGVVVIQYDNVYNPTTKTKKSYIVRYYHLYSIKVKKGQKVNAYDVIGTESGSHKYWNHIHFEIDSDTKYPYYTPQVAEASSKLLIRKGAKDSTILNPLTILVVGKKQTAKVHSLAPYATTAQDSPRFAEGESPKAVEKPIQKLILPITDAKLTCGYKNAYYYSIFKLHHYGIDITSVSGNTAIYGMGDGKVIAAGWDGISTNQTGAGSGCGYVVIIQYDNVWNHNKKSSCNVVCTLMHLKEQPKVKVGDAITTKTLIGNYGATGAYVDGPHLHIQFDTDTAHPFACMPMSASGHKILMRGTVDSTVEPCYLLHLGKGQLITPGKYEQQYDKSKILSMPTISA